MFPWKILMFWRTFTTKVPYSFRNETILNFYCLCVHKSWHANRINEEHEWFWTCMCICLISTHLNPDRQEVHLFTLIHIEVLEKVGRSVRSKHPHVMKALQRIGGFLRQGLDHQVLGGFRDSVVCFSWRIINGGEVEGRRGLQGFVFKFSLCVSTRRHFGMFRALVVTCCCLFVF